MNKLKLHINYPACGHPPGDYTNPVNKKKIKIISREALLHYMGNPYPATQLLTTAEELRAECALLGEGWRTLEIEHFYEWQYINHAIYREFRTVLFLLLILVIGVGLNAGADDCKKVHIAHPMLLDGILLFLNLNV